MGNACHNGCSEAVTSNGVRTGDDEPKLDCEPKKPIRKVIKRPVEPPPVPSFGGATGSSFSPPDTQPASPRTTVAREEQLSRLLDDGFCCTLHQWSDLSDASQKPKAPFSPDQVALRQRVLRNTYFDGSYVLCISLDESMLEWKLREEPVLAKWLWKEKKILVFMRLSTELSPLRDGARVMKLDAAKLEEKLSKASSLAAFGVKSSAYIQTLRPTGVAAAVRQQFATAQAVAARGLVPLLHFHVAVSPYDQPLCEQRLLLEVLDGLDALPRGVGVVLVLTTPMRPNTYFPLTLHPSVLRVLMCEGSQCHGREDACKWLEQNFRVSADFEHAFFSDLLVKALNNWEFENKFSKIRKEIAGACNKKPANRAEVQRLKLGRSQAGFLVDLSPQQTQEEKVLEEQRLALKLLTNSMFNGTRILAAIMAPKALHLQVANRPVAPYLWEHRGIAAILQVDSTGDSEKFEETLDQAAELGFAGVEFSTVIEKVSQEDLGQLIEKQFSLARRVSAKQLLPLCRLEVGESTATQKGAAEADLLQVLLSSLGEFTCEEQIVLELVEPSKRNLYLPLTNHPSVVRVVLRPNAQRGDLPRPGDALRLLEQNESIAGVVGQGLLAALMEQRPTQQPPPESEQHEEEDCARRLSQACQELYRAATARSVREEQRTKLMAQEGFFALLDRSMYDLEIRAQAAQAKRNTTPRRGSGLPIGLTSTTTSNTTPRRETSSAGLGYSSPSSTRHIPSANSPALAAARKLRRTKSGVDNATKMKLKSDLRSGSGLGESGKGTPAGTTPTVTPRSAATTPTAAASAAVAAAVAAAEGGSSAAAVLASTHSAPRRSPSAPAPQLREAAAVANAAHRFLNSRESAAFKALVARIVSHAEFEGGNVLGAVLSEGATFQESAVKGLPMPRFLWERRRVVPFMALDGQGLGAEGRGVQLAKGVSDTDVQLQAKLSKAVKAGVFGTKLRSCIRQADEGIRALVVQQFRIAKLAVAQGLVPLVHIEIDADPSATHYCEHMLFDELVIALDQLNPKEQLLLMLSAPSAGNVPLYLPLQGHPSVVRLLLDPPVGDRGETCRRLSTSFAALVPAFDRSLLEGLSLEQPDAEFSEALTGICSILRCACMGSVQRDEQMMKVTNQPGFFVCFAQDASTTSTVLRSYTAAAIGEEIKRADLNMRAHEMRARIIANPSFNGMRVLGAILTEPSLASTFDHLPCARYLWERKRVVPLLRLDQGLNKEHNGVQMFKEDKNMDKLLSRAIAAGIFGTVTRSAICAPKPKAIAELFAQQVSVTKKVLAKGQLMPIMQVEVLSGATNKPQCESLLLKEVLAGLDSLPSDARVIVDVGLPSTANTFLPVAQHPKVVRLAALSGGLPRDEAVKKVQENQMMIASFGRAFQEGLSVNQTDKDFSEVLASSCKAIYEASSCRPTGRRMDTRQQNKLASKSTLTLGSTASTRNSSERT